MKSDLISGILFFALGAALLVKVLISYNIGTLQMPGGGFFPLMGCALLLFFSILLVAQSIPRSHNQQGNITPFFPTKQTPKRIFFAFLSLLFYRYLFKAIGFAPVTGIFILFLAKFVGDFSWKTSFIFSVITAVVAYYLFQVILKVPMPTPLFSL